MAIYEYRGINSRGKNLKGLLDASSVENAREKLKGQGIFLQSIQEATKSKRKINLSFSFTGKRNIVTQITRQLSFLLSASLPVDSAIEGVIDQTEDSEIKKMMIGIKEKIKEGKSVSQAFSDHPEYFNKMYISTLHAGEVSGKLDVVFDRLSSMYEKNQVLKSKLRASLTYPSLMLVFAFLIIVFLVSFLIPTFSKMFVEFGQVLPLPTRILIGISNIVTKAWWAIIIFLALLAFIFNRVYKNEKGKKYFDLLVLRLPVIKNLVLGTFTVRFSYTMSLMLYNGVGIIESLENTLGIFRNVVFKDLLNNSIEMVRKGEKLSRALASGIVFNSSILGMIHAGEAGDRVPDVLEKIGNNAEVELEEKIKTLTSLIEPLVIMIIGIFVGFVVLAIMLPIFQVNQIFG
jgi:general secretion pathway protein F